MKVYENAGETKLLFLDMTLRGIKINIKHGNKYNLKCFKC